MLNYFAIPAPGPIRSPRSRITQGIRPPLYPEQGYPNEMEAGPHYERIKYHNHEDGAPCTFGQRFLSPVCTAQDVCGVRSGGGQIAEKPLF